MLVSQIINYFKKFTKFYKHSVGYWPIYKLNIKGNPRDKIPFWICPFYKGCIHVYVYTKFNNKNVSTSVPFSANVIMTWRKMINVNFSNTLPFWPFYVGGGLLINHQIRRGCVHVSWGQNVRPRLWWSFFYCAPRRWQHHEWRSPEKFSELHGSLRRQVPRCAWRPLFLPGDGCLVLLHDDA